jgi:hypothetical protein
MMRRLDQAAAILVALVGLVHLAVGHQAFLAPTPGGVWFASAGFLLVTTGLANLACGASLRPGRLNSGAALSGAAAILVLGGLTAAADPNLLFAPQTLVLLVLGLFLAVRRLGGLFGPARP